MTPPTANPPSPTSAVLVLDFATHYAQLMAQRVREAHVYSEQVPQTIPAAEVQPRNTSGIIFTGGPMSVHVDGAPFIDPEVYELGVPVLGICYGAQLIAHQLGGRVDRTDRGEYGRTPMSVHDSGLLFGGGVPTEQQVWMIHFATIGEAPAGFAVTASTPDTPVAALESRKRGLFGVQFHPEVAHTPYGQQVIQHFLYDACGCEPRWTMGSVIDTQVE